MLNPFFLNGSTTEQNLINDLVKEAIQIHGVDVYYLPREYVTKRTVIREVIESKFSNAFPLEAYIDTYEGYEGAGVLLSKFGIQPSTDITLIISKERYETYITPLIKNIPNIKLSDRPKEGDLIWFPLGDRLFEIKFIEHEIPFYQLQKTYVYNLKCELFRYQDEIIATNIDFIDDNTKDQGYTEFYNMLARGEQASAITSLEDCGVRYVTVTKRGVYSSTPTVNFPQSPEGITATGVARMISGIVDLCEPDESKLRVQAVDIINPGSGYCGAVIDSFDKSLIRFKKYLIHVNNNSDPNKTQNLLLNLIHNNGDIIVNNQYGLGYSQVNLGNFSGRMVDSRINLIFSPFDVSSTYSINSFSFDINDSDTTVGNISLGDVVKINSSNVSGEENKTIIKIPNTKSAAKVLIVYSDLINNKFYSEEINYIQDGVDILYNTYGSLDINKPSGIGTYALTYDGPDINIEFYPDENTEFNINVLSIEISDLSATSTGTLILSGSRIESTYVGVNSSGSPQKTLIYSYNNNFNSGLHQILIETESNNNINYSEVLTLLNSSNKSVNSVEFGKLNLRGEIGIIETEYLPSTNTLEMYFTPYQDIDYQVRICSILTSTNKRSEILSI